MLMESLSLCAIRAHTGVAPVKQAMLATRDVAVNLREPVEMDNPTPAMPVQTALSIEREQSSVR